MEQGFSATQPERVHVISFVLGLRWCDGLAGSLESSRSNILEKSICRRNKKWMEISTIVAVPKCVFLKIFGVLGK